MDKNERCCTSRSMNLRVVRVCKQLNIDILVALVRSDVIAQTRDHGLVISFGLALC